LRSVTIQELTDHLPGSSPERWEQLLDYLISSHIANCINCSKNYKSQSLPAGHFYANATVMLNIVGKNKAPFHKAYLLALNQLNIVRPAFSGSYMVGEICKCYCFTEPQLERGFNMVQLVNPKVIKRMLKEAETNSSNDTYNFEDIHFELARMVDKIVVPRFEDLVSKMNFDKRNFKSEEEKENYQSYRRQAYTLTLESLQLRIYRHRNTLSPNNRRFNSLVTKMKKELRRSARFYDDLDTPLVEKDASNSQFWLLTAFNTKHIQAFIYKHYPEYAEKIIKRFAWLETQDDFQIYKALTTKGELYRAIVDKLNDANERNFQKTIDSMPPDGTMDVSIRKVVNSRTYVKGKAMSILFGRDLKEGQLLSRNNKSYPYSKPLYKQVFDEMFPSVKRVLASMRQLMGVSEFACLMQAVESHIWIDGIAALMCEQGFDDFLTVHDCIMVKENCVDQFQRLCSYYFENVLKMEMPNIK